MYEQAGPHDCEDIPPSSSSDVESEEEEDPCTSANDEAEGVDDDKASVAGTDQASVAPTEFYPEVDCHDPPVSRLAFHLQDFFCSCAVPQKLMPKGKSTDASYV
jgi:hypothetical protein